MALLDPIAPSAKVPTPYKLAKNYCRYCVTSATRKDTLHVFVHQMRVQNVMDPTTSVVADSRKARSQAESVHAKLCHKTLLLPILLNIVLA